MSDCARAQRIHKIDRQGHYCRRQQLWFGMCYVIKHTIITINSLFNKSTEGRKWCCRCPSSPSKAVFPTSKRIFTKPLIDYLQLCKDSLKSRSTEQRGDFNEVVWTLDETTSFRVNSIVKGSNHYTFIPQVNLPIWLALFFQSSFYCVQVCDRPPWHINAGIQCPHHPRSSTFWPCHPQKGGHELFSISPTFFFTNERPMMIKGQK